MKKTSKKQLVAAILAGLTLATAAPAMAATNPFNDVPANHWAYGAVSKLAAGGIVDGYGDGTFKGDKTMTRYEMAQIVGKAMAHEDKANAEQKAMIDKLAKEFADELDALGVRVTKLENKVGNITWSGQVREWYEWNKDDTAEARTTRLLLFMKAPLADGLSFNGRIWGETAWGQQTDPTHGSVTTGADMSMDQAYLAYSKGNTSWTLGRQGFMLGEGLVYAFFPNNDGATVTFGSDNTKVTLAALKTNWIVGSTNLYAAQIMHKASDNLDLSLVYAKNKSSDAASNLDSTEGEVFNTWAFGGVYKGMKNLTLTAEYGQNNSDRAKDPAVNGEKASGYVAQLKYRGADWAKVHSFGIWAGYRKAEDGFNGRNGDYIWETNNNPYNMDDVKGADFGVDYTVFKNAIMTLQYFDLEDDKTGDVDKKGFVAQLRYMF